MARGGARAPSQHAYRGVAGQTRHTTVHVTTRRGELAVATVVEAVDAVSDPDLARLFLDDDRWSHIGLPDGTTVRLALTTVYHDPAAEVLALVLPEDQRHRELDERIRLLERMKQDDCPIPPYARDFAVVFGAAGLRAYLERQAEEALIQGRIADQLKDLERKRADVDRRDAELGRREADIERGRSEIERVREDVERRWGEVDLREAEVGRREAVVLAQAERAPSRSSSPTIPRPQNGARTAASGAARHEREEGTNPFELAREAAIATVVAAPPEMLIHAEEPPAVPAWEPPASIWDESGTDQAARPAVPIHEADSETTGRADPPGAVIVTQLPPGSDPLTTTTEDLAGDGPLDGDPWLAGFATGSAGYAVATGDTAVRLALRVPDQAAPALAHGSLDVRLLLLRTEHYPVVALVIGSPAALRDGQGDACAVALLDIGVEGDRAALTQLGKTFTLLVDLVGSGRRLRQTRLDAPLSENVGFVTRAADDHLRTVMAEAGAGPSIARARQSVTAPGYDLFGLAHPEAGEFRDDKLAQLETANQLRRALAIASRFTKPSREDYLVCVRGFPLPRWREIRRVVLSRAVDWGLWMGPELAQVAVSEGFARSRRDLVVKLVPAFEALRGSPVFDLDGDAAEDNHKVLVDEARTLGVNLTEPRTVDSQATAAASGTIERPRSQSEGGRGRPVDELIAALEQRSDRLAAALELCERGDPRGLEPVMTAVKKMSRAEAVRVLGMSVRFGPAAAPMLLDGLASSKAYLRHGCALALAMLRTEVGTESVIELLLTEPTEIWREIARAVGQVGPPALMPLASQLGRMGERATASARERVAWAMAHVAVRGGKAAVEALAGGASVVAPVAKTALELLASAANDEVRVRSPSGGTSPGREVTVNRAFSRRFFESLEKGLPDVAHAELSAMDASEPMELLDDDLLEEDVDIDEDAAELDESDIIAS